MNHRQRLAISRIAPSLSKRVFFSKYKKAMYTRTLPAGWKELEIFLLSEILDEQAVFFDVGANVGIYTYLASQYTAEKNLHAFEPMPNYFNALKSLFPNSQINNSALSNTTGEFDLKIPKIKGKLFTARASLNTDFKEENEESSMVIPVKTITLDEYCSKNDISRVDLIKIDVEGHEKNVLEGGLSAIKEYKPTLIVEIEQRHHKKSVSETIDKIRSMNFECFYVNSSHTLMPISGDISEYQKKSEFGTSSYVNNFIFKPVT